MKDLKSLVVKLRARFTACVKVDQMATRKSAPTLVIAQLNAHQSSLQNQMDQIIDFCEDSGFGRVESEEAIMDILDFS